MHNKRIGEATTRSMYFHIKVIDSVQLTLDGPMVHLFVLEDHRLGWFAATDETFYHNTNYVIYGYPMGYFKIDKMTPDQDKSFSVLYDVFDRGVRSRNFLPRKYTHATRISPDPKLIRFIPSKGRDTHHPYGDIDD